MPKSWALSLTPATKNKHLVWGRYQQVLMEIQGSISWYLCFLWLCSSELNKSAWDNMGQGYVFQTGSFIDINGLCTPLFLSWFHIFPFFPTIRLCWINCGIHAEGAQTVIYNLLLCFCVVFSPFFSWSVDKLRFGLVVGHCFKSCSCVVEAVKSIITSLESVLSHITCLY